MAWSLTPPIRAFKYLGHTGPVLTACYGNDGTLVTGSSDCTVRIWTANVKGDSIFKKVHSKPVRSVHFSPDSKLILTASDDKSIKIFDI